MEAIGRAKPNRQPTTLNPQQKVEAIGRAAEEQLVIEASLHDLQEHWAYRALTLAPWLPALGRAHTAPHAPPHAPPHAMPHAPLSPQSLQSPHSLQSALSTNSVTSVTSATSPHAPHAPGRSSHALDSAPDALGALGPLAPLVLTAHGPVALELEDGVLTVQALLAAPASGPFRAELSTTLAELSGAAETLAQWVQVDRPHPNT